MSKKHSKKAIIKTAAKKTAKKSATKLISVSSVKKKQPAKKSIKKVVKKSPAKKTVKKKVVKKRIEKNSPKIFSGITRDEITKKYERYPLETAELNLPVFQERGINIQGIGFEKEMKLRAEGIKNIDDFIAVGQQGIARIFGVNLDYAKGFFIKAKAVKDNKVYQIKPLSTIDTNCIMLDIETDYFEGKYVNKTAWMVGMLDRPTNQLVQYVAHNEKEVSDIISKTYDFLDSFSNRKIIVYSGTNFDATILKHRFEYYNRTHHHLTFKDILIEMRNCMAFPFKSMDLGSVAEHYDFKFRHPHIDGREVGMAWETHKNDMKKHRSFKKYCEYNQDDVKSLNTVFENIYINRNYNHLG